MHASLFARMHMSVNRSALEITIEHICALTFYDYCNLPHTSNVYVYVRMCLHTHCQIISQLKIERELIIIVYLCTICIRLFALGSRVGSFIYIQRELREYSPCAYTYIVVTKWFTRYRMLKYTISWTLRWPAGTGSALLSLYVLFVTLYSNVRGDYRKGEFALNASQVCSNMQQNIA